MSDVTIPEDVKAKAQRLWEALRLEANPDRQFNIIVEALLAERERCAKIADEHARARTSKEFTATQAGRLTARSIAFSIRSPHE